MPQDFERKDRYKMEDLIKIMEVLRGENGCPWDREQDHHSIRKNFLEETYEVLEAIDNEDPKLLREELGDVLLQVVFHARMEEEQGRFDFDDVANDICQKLIIRHPHIFGDIKVSSAGQVLVNWDKIKQATKGQKTATETLENVPKVLPALMRAGKVQQRAARAGFDYDGVTGALADLKSEIAELEEAIAKGEKAQCREEMGDLFFAAVNVSRFLDADAEETLSEATDKFIRRFAVVEQLAKQNGVDMKQSDLAQLDVLWKEAKKQLSNG
ncbi:nucleoside triphosphate pyrophosphohydrolase [Zongyangia hominis]|uniref:Nucleoside triphosphate pyrophosphohydrolase n=1 Tax=Zongyangia hominis TaxID=2763677 RepID=A0A926IA36_9FIRM|nr:nucleoside triphosphate pyrophosphohydrolase [Zongyangia hominis]MBC8569806.1 nucleoside triphosphate pyrophosphohydrolase [Zongyangia hominis]